MNGVVKNISALSIVTTGQLPKFTKGQSALLELIKACIANKQSLTFELIAHCYYHSVRKTFFEGKGWYYPDESNWRSGKYKEYIEHDILICMKEDKLRWKWRPQIRQWFVSNIGILVIKNQLVIVPTIDLGEDEMEILKP